MIPWNSRVTVAYATPRTVIAHYIPHLAAYGQTVAGYKLDIQDAQAAGVDAFVLDEFGWAGTGNDFSTMTANIFEAALELGTGFKLYLMSDSEGQSYEAAAIVAAGTMLAAYANHPNYLSLNGRPLFSGWASGLNTANGSADNTYWSGVSTNIVGTGLNPFFFPALTDGSLTVANVNTWYNAGTWMPSIVQGLMELGDSRPADNQVNKNAAKALVMSNHGKAFGAGVDSWHAPIRFLSQGLTNQVDVVEFNGGEGVSAIWLDLINNVKPSFVLLATWNDYSENYMGPASQANLITNNLSSWGITGDYLFSHAGFTELNKYFIQWYKTGTQPIWPDAMYVFYRNAATSVVASGAAAGTTINWNGGGTTTLDDLYITTILTASATLTVTTGGTPNVFGLSAGISHTRVPFSVGTQTFVLVRSSTTIISITGANVVSSETLYYNVNPLSYFGYFP
jgi:hypothetical protein